jgi:hypothetical protein
MEELLCISVGWIGFSIFADGLLLLQSRSLADFIEYFSEGGRQPSFKKN